MTPELAVQMRKFAVGELITLYQLDLTRLGGLVYYFTNNVFEERVPIAFGGHDYTHHPVHMSEVEVDSQGAPAQPTFTIFTGSGPVNALVRSYNDLRGAKVYRFRTFAEFLDVRPDGNGDMEANPDADAEALFGLEMYVIDRKMAAHDVMAEFQLIAPTDYEGVELPLRIVRKRWCDAHYRVRDDAEGDGFYYFLQVDGGCPYSGTAYFNENDEACAKDDDRCSKRVSGCLLRYGQASALPMQAFPGVKAGLEA